MAFSQGLVEEENEEPGFEIIHLSFRKKESESIYGGPVDYYIGNIVFRLTDKNAKGRMEYIMAKNEKIRVSVSEDLLDKYFEDLHFVWGDDDDDDEEDEVGDENKFTPLKIENKSGITDDEVFIYGYRRNMMPLHDFVQYEEKFDCYRMHEYFQDTPVVRGIIQYLQDMKNGKPNPSRTVYHEQFLSTLENLCWWWD